jgi:hypothetical protein
MAPTGNTVLDLDRPDTNHRAPKQSQVIKPFENNRFLRGYNC